MYFCQNLFGQTAKCIPKTLSLCIQSYNEWTNLCSIVIWYDNMLLSIKIDIIQILISMTQKIKTAKELGKCGKVKIYVCHLHAVVPNIMMMIFLFWNSSS